MNPFVLNHDMNLLPCKNCGETKEIHAKELCYKCYRKISWKSKPVICKHCGCNRPHQAKGLCASCFLKIFRYQYIKDANSKKYHNISPGLYKTITQTCVICGFDKIINLHHLDHNKKNNAETNLVGLCPNHHKLIHDYRYSQEVVDALAKKGYKAKLTKF